MNKMKKCGVCEKEIAKSAKTCPECGAKQKEAIYTKWWFWVIIAVVIIAIASASSTDTPSDTPDAQQSQSSDTAPQKDAEPAYKVGDVITTDKFEITVTEVFTRNSVGNEFWEETASEGGTYVVVHWEVKNVSSEPISSFGCPTIRIVDANDVKYDSDTSASTAYSTEIEKDTKILSDLNPGIKVKDADVFEIAEESYNKGGFSVVISADKRIVIPIN